MLQPKKNQALKRAIKDAGLTQRLVAYRAKVHENRLSLLVNGWARPSELEKFKLAVVLDRPVDQLFPNGTKE